MKCKILTLSALIITSSCTLQPDYHRPYVELPCEWTIDEGQISAYCSKEWWSQFEDPVLPGLIETALENNKDLSIAIARVHQAIAQLGVVSGDLYPQIDGTASAFRQESSLDTVPVPGVKRIINTYTTLFNMAYEVDIWGRIRSATDASYSELLASESVRDGVILTLISGVANGYLLLRQYDAQLEIAKQTYRSRVESYDLAKIRFEGGLTSELEVAQAESSMWDTKAEEKQIELLVEQQENFLSVLLGLNPQSIIRGASLDQMKVPLIPTGLPSEILEQRPDIIEAEDLLMAANAEIGVARAALFPSISLTGSYGNISLELHNLFKGRNRSWNYGATLLQPIFTGWRLTSQIELQEAIKEEAYYNYQQVVIKAFQEVEDAISAHHINEELVNVQQKRVKALEQYLHLANLQYDNGQTDYLNVLDAERGLFAGQLDLASAKSAYLQSFVDLYKAFGGSWLD